MKFFKIISTLVISFSCIKFPIVYAEDYPECNGNPACKVVKMIKDRGRVTKENIETVLNDPMQFARDLGTWTGNTYKNSIFGKIAEFSNNYTGSYWDTVNGTEYNIFNCLASGGTSQACNLPDTNLRYDSGYRNYYNNDYMINTSTSGNYNTTYTNVVDYRNSKINYYNNSTNEWNYFDYRDYYYDITNNHYYYTDVHNYIYDIDYNYNYTTVNIINPDGFNQVTKNYWEMPTGNGSFNYTKENILGYKLDYNVKKYELLNNEENVIGLFHLNNNRLNSSSGNVNLNNVYTSTWLSSGVGFGSYPNMGINNDIRFSLDDIGTGDFSIEFRYYPYSKSKKVEVKLENGVRKYYFEENIKSILPQFRLYNGSTYRYVFIDDWVGTIDTGTWHTIKISRLNNVTKLYVDGVNTTSSTFMFYDGTNGKPTRATIDYLFRDYNLKYFLIYGGNNYGNEKLSYGNNYEPYKFITDKIWSSSTWEGSLNVVYVMQEGLYNIDEVLVKNIGEHFNYTPKSVEYDTTRIYTVPETLDVLNNTVLIQSNFDVNGYQFGGVRPFTEENGYVWFYVDEDGFIQDVQQMEFGQWERIAASVYSQTKLRWVNIIGSKINDDYIDPDAYSPNTNIGETNVGFLQSWFTIFRDRLDGIIYSLENLQFPDINHVENDPDYINNNYEEVTNNYINLYSPTESTTNEVNNFRQEVRQRIGIFGQSLDLVEETSNRIKQAESGNAVFEWENISFMEVVIIPSGSFSLNDFVNSNSTFNFIYNTYLIIVDGLILFSLFRMLYEKLNRILSR